MKNLIFLILVVAVAASGMMVTATPTMQEPSTFFGVDAQSGEIVTLPLASSGTDSLFVCGGQAPLDHYCATGEHNAEDVWIHGFASPFPTAGTLESRLIHAGGAQIFRCDYLQGQTVSCFVVGQAAPSQGIIFHDCYAYFPKTAGLIPLSPGPGDPTGVPGGLGPWQCLLA